MRAIDSSWCRSIKSSISMLKPEPWTGYLRIHKLSTNLFIPEKRLFSNGDRALFIHAMTESGSRPEEYIL